MFYIALCDLPSSIRLWESLIKKISIVIVAKSKLPTGLNLMAHDQKEARMHSFVAASETLDCISNCCVCHPPEHHIQLLLGASSFILQ